MINNPKLIKKIKERIRNTSKEQLDRAFREVDKEFYGIYKYNNGENEIIYFDYNDYNVFYLHKTRTNRQRNNMEELEAA